MVSFYQKPVSEFDTFEIMDKYHVSNKTAEILALVPEKGSWFDYEDAKSLIDNLNLGAGEFASAMRCTADKLGI